MMTRIQEGNEVFVHTSDIQLLADEPIAQILAWSPTTLLTSGPPLYRNLPADELSRARVRALELARHIPVLSTIISCDAEKGFSGWTDCVLKPAEKSCAQPIT